MKKVLYGIWLVLLISGNIFPQDSNNVKTKVLIKTSASWDGSALPDYPGSKPEITILEITIPPNTKLPMHKHPEINAGVLLSGELTVKTGNGKVLHLKAGDPIVETVNKWHYGENNGNTPAKIIVFYAGTVGTPITITK
ncbi:MAG: cupin domain-containing protein [Ignavibacteriaceae bacterium]